MLTLHGFPVSNYYNKVKLALLEKGVAFDEVYAGTRSTDEAVLSKTPLGKIPFITTDEGSLCESTAIMEWIEAKWPQPALLPADPFAAAKVRELTIFLDWHLEIAARQVYGPAFFGSAPLSESNAARIRKQIDDAITGFKRLAKFAPFVAGAEMTQADCSAFVNLPLVGMATKIVYGEDALLAAGVDYKAYVKMIGERPSGQRVNADRKAAQTKS
ncbi:glutathione S-transferase [Caenimonas koreensis DSM 17982]|uniref:Glutathione S-transferase n=1 Tax=Caenimonas koreensis DSM 17982 TaxID=1121255 RepID=A0A844B9E3_9BURK|nr:glutathione S-transferase [Caenimonas koreensis]MRD48219.1 glutathione S-transferase [Caenimonas koreensis DSM 17982]